MDIDIYKNMNEQAINDLYNLAKQNGYSKSLDEFVNLMYTNDNAFNDMYSLAQSNGYQKSQDDFSVLIGKKKSEVQPQPTAQAQPMAQKPQAPDAMASSSGASSLASPSAEERGLTLLAPDRIKQVAEEAKTGVYMGSQMKQPVMKVEALPPSAPSKSEQDFNISLEEVNKDLMDYDEDYIVPKLDYLFGKDKYGFEFSQARVGREAVEVKAPNGKTMVIPVDAWTEKGDIESAEKFKKFLNENKPKLAKLSDEYNIYQSTIKNEQDMKKATESMNAETMQLNKIQQDLVLENTNLDKELKYLQSVPQSERGSQDYINKLDEYNKRKTDFSAKLNNASLMEKDISAKQSQLYTSIGRYSFMRAEQGGFLGGLYNSLLGGYSSIGAAATGITTDVIMSLPLELTTSPKDIQETFTMVASSKGVEVPANMDYEKFKQWSQTLDEDTKSEINSEVKDYLTKRTKGEMLPSIRKGLTETIGAKGTTPEYIQDAGLIKGGIYGLAASLPAMSFAGAGPAGTMSAFFLQGYDATMKEMESEEFKGVSENEKYLVALPVGIVSAALEEFGMRNVLGKSGIVNDIVAKALSKSSSGTTATTFKQLVENEIESRVARGVLVMTAAGLSEAETGAAQAAAEIGIKEIYNTVKGKDMFKTPETVGEFIKEVAVAGAQEAIGGVVMGSFNAVSTAYGENNFNGVTNETLEIFNKLANDDNARGAYAVDLKMKIVKGEITAEQGKKALDDLNNSISVFNSIPDDLAPAQQRQAFSLLRERKGLEAEIQGKDEAMVKKQKARIAEINDELGKVSEVKAAPAETPAITYDQLSDEAKGMVERELDLYQSNIDNAKENNREPDERDVQQLELLKSNPVTFLEQVVSTTTNEERKTLAEQALTKIKEEQDAIQKQTAGEVPVQPTARPSQEVAQGEPQAEPQGTPQAGVEEEVARMEQLFGETEQLMPATVEASTLEALPIEQKIELTFTQEDGTVTPLNGNEAMASKMYEEAMAVPKAERTPAQQSVVDAVSVSLKTQQGQGVSVSNKSQVAQLETKTTDANKKKIIKAATTAINTLKSIFPDMDIVIHESNDSYTKQVGQSTRGNFAVTRTADGKIVGGRIDINLSKANMRTVAHEVAHAVMLKAFGDNPALFKVFRDRITKILADTSVEKLNDFASQYEENDSHEEFLVELSAALTEAQKQLTPITVNKIAQLINKVVSKITGGRLQPFGEKIQTNELIDFLNTMSAAIGKGEAIQVKEGETKGAAGVVSKAQKDEITKFAEDEKGKRRPEQGGDRTGRYSGGSLAPLTGAPNFQGAKGPDPQLVAVAEKYAKENGIDLKRQAEYVQVDVERAKRIAEAFENMVDNPQDPKVREAYADLIEQTKKQYQALVDAGYVFSFFDGETDPYNGNPVDAMRDLRNNKKMAVYGTYAGYGTEGITKQERENNPMLEDTGLIWKDQNGVEYPVTANDLFRAVHDAFGHGLEGAGFRARGEENAWQAHVRLFTGPAVAAITTETRGQNSWLNYGPYGEQNKNAKVEDTVFADNKIGLMPEWTWTEGRAADMPTTTVSKAQVASEVKEMGDTFTVSKAQVGDEEMRKIVKDARAQGFSEEAIKAFLIKKGITAQEADTLMAKPEAAKKVTMTEKNLLKIKIKEYTRGAKDAKTAIANATKDLTDMLAEMVNGGKISSAQLRTIIRKFGSLNVLNEKSLNRFIDYMTKVIADADYSSKLENAQSLRKAIKKLSRNKDKNASMRELAKSFVDIDPSLVDDIDAYNDIAQKIKESVKGSTIREGKITQAEMVSIEDSNEYISETMDAQRQKLFDEKAAEIQELLGVDVSDLSYEQLLEMIDKKEKITKYNEGLVRSAIIRMFGTYSSIINEMFSTSKDPFTGEDIDIDPKKKELVQRFMNMDLTQLTAKQGLEAVDALTNFIQNGSTAKMEAVVSEYTGEKNAIELEEKGIKSESLKAYWSKGIGRLFGEQFMSLPVLLERMFKGVKKASLFEKMSGLIELRNKKSAADRKVTDIINDYVEKFYKEKANGEDFNTSYNATERGLVAFMTRNVVGTAKQMAEEFARRKALIEESIEVLSKGTNDEKTKAELYQKAYDKLLKDSKNGDEVRSKADKKNLEAIDYWKNKWAEIYDDLSDVSENVYNTLLDKDLNYTPDRYTRLDSAGERTPLENDQSMFHGNTNTIYKKKTGVLMEAERPKQLPRFEGKKKAGMYVDLSFDRNNANSMYDALVDINTAATIRQVQAFINSESFDSIIDNPKDAKLLKGRIQQFVRNMRDKNIVESDELSKAARSLNVMATIGVGQALGGFFQPFKQTIPVIVNTMINAGKINMSIPFTSAVNDFLNNSGYAIANRGLASSAEISSIEKLADLGESSLGEKALKKIEAANKKMLEILLVKADIAVARASWIAYYEKSLQEQGIDTKGIDYSTHKLNKEAADYAQRMVDRQQNISDHDLAGKMFTSKAPMNQLFVKAVMPFASFRINQWMRMTTDLATLKSKTATKEDKRIAARSLAGFTAEMFTFKVISFGLIVLMGTLTKALMGHDEDEDEEKKRIANAKKGVLTGTVTDVFSPLPFMDKPVQAGGAWLLDKVQSIMDIAEEEKISIYGTQKSDIFTGLGSLGIAGERLYQMVELINLSTNGKFKDDYGNEKQVSQQDMDVLKAMIGLSVLSTVGLAPAEVNTIVRNSIKFAKKGGKTEKSMESEQFKPPYGLTKQEFKRYFPEEYEKRYGEGSLYYKMTQPERDMKKKAEDEKQKLMDEYYDYEEKSKKKGGFGSKGFGEKSGFGSKGFGKKD